MQRAIQCASIAVVLWSCVPGDPGAGQHALGGGTCEPTIATLFAGRTLDAGEVRFESTSTELVVRIATSDGWQIEAVHAYAGIAPVPTNPAGNVAPGTFPYAQTPSPATGVVEIRIPLAELGASCGTELHTAVHADLARVRVGGYVQREGAWSYGTPFSGRQWGWTSTTTVCCEEVTGCTLTQGYWKNHEADWPASSLVLGAGRYSQAELLALLDTPPRGDASLILAHQLVAAKLNVATGATAGAEAAAATSAADAWLSGVADASARLPFGVPASTPSGAEAVAIADALAAYNEGRLGTPHCE